MSALINYQDTATIVVMGGSSEYANDKSVEEMAAVSVVFLQNTGLSHGAYQDAITSDAIMYVDPEDGFVQSHFYRLEDMFVLAPLFGATDPEGWYKIESVTVNRDHLLSNEIDNVECALKKTHEVVIDNVS